MKWIPFVCQEFAVQFMLDHEHCAALMDMGLGKTVCSLTTVADLIYNRFEVSRVLVIAPKRVVENVWSQEAKKWDHLKHLTVSLVLGDQKQRSKALDANANIFVINRENVAWLVAKYQSAWPFDMVIVDEFTSFKNPSSQRFKAYRRIRPKVKRTIELSGTPTPNGLMDLWAPMYMLDGGVRLGESFSKFRERYFTKNPFVKFGAYELRREEENSLLGEGIYEKEILEKISDITFSMKKRDYIDMPDVIHRDVPVTLPAEMMRRYFDFERKLVLAMDETEPITAVNAAALNTKLLQFVNGAVYDDTKLYHEIHTHKIDALEEILEDLNGNPLLVFYSYKHDAARFKRLLARFKPRELKGRADVEAWNKRGERFMYGHPASMSEGLNLQAGGHNVLWFGMHYNRGWYDQGIARVDRTGQEFPVVNNRLIARGTIDEEAAAVLDSKGDTQDMVMRAFKARVAKYRKMKVA